MYLIASVEFAGRSLGMRASRIAVIDAKRGGKPPLKTVLLRYVYMALGALPNLLWTGYAYFIGVGTTQAALARTFVVGAALGLCGAGWIIANLVLIVRKRDPLFDRWAGKLPESERDRLTAPV